MTTDNSAIAEQQKIEQMNEIIAQFDGWELKKGDSNHLCARHDQNIIPSECTCYLKVDGFVSGVRLIYTYQMKYHSDWNLLHGAWDKVYEPFLKIDYTDEKAIHFHFCYSRIMGDAMITGNITTAHRILYDAIMWVKNNEG